MTMRSPGPNQNSETVATLKIKVVPCSSRDEIVGWLGDALKVKVRAKPEAGKANKAVVNLLSGYFEVPRNQIEITAGTSNPQKVVDIEGWDEAQIRSWIDNQT